MLTGKVNRREFHTEEHVFRMKRHETPLPYCAETSLSLAAGGFPRLSSGQSRSSEPLCRGGRCGTAPWGALPVGGLLN